MALTHITDHEAQAEELLLEQYKGKPRVLALLLSFIRRCQELEDAAWDVIVQRMIDHAEGAQLDAIGRIVGQVRGEQDDDTYRVYLTARIRVNHSVGTPNDLLDVLSLIETAAFEYTEHPPATTLILYEEPETVPQQALIDLLRATRATGTALFILAGDSGTDNQLLAVDITDGAPEDDSDHGLADTDAPDAGGRTKDVLVA